MTSTSHHIEPTTTRSRSTKVALVAAGVVGAAALAFGGGAVTSAFFTSQASVVGHGAETATIEITATTASASAPIDVADMLPGDTSSTLIELDNTGSESLYYTVRIVPLGGADVVLEDALEVTVAVGAASETRTLTAWRDGALQIGPALASGASQNVAVTMTLPTATGNTVQGKSTGFSVQFDAIQQRNVTAPTAGWHAD